MPRKYHNARADILQSMPGTSAELVKKSGYCRCTVERWLRVLQAEPGRQCRIVDWRRPNTSGNYIAVYGLGTEPDAECTFKPITASEDWQRRKERYGMDVLRKQERARHYALKARRGKISDPLQALLCGRGIPGIPETHAGLTEDEV